jgi:hypothetical protein
MRSNSHPVEARQFGRRQTCWHAVISAPGRSSIACIVRNISEDGALLEVAQASWLPSRFRVIIEANKFEADCEIVHRTDNAVGVRFTRGSSHKV